ncbi:MAG: hypothetical protein GXY55_01040 [Phycisphaerae bacterium]|nr:hypothetical protein [Phycisphaerae bacterium]
MIEPGKPHFDDDDRMGLPSALRAALCDLHRPTKPVPTGFDKAVLAAARREWLRQRRRRLVIWLVPATAAAAAIVLVVWLGGFWSGPAGSVSLSPMVSAPPSQTPLKDINGDGQVDILDALMLARRVEAADIAGLEWDFNGDRVVDRGDVDTVALAAVRLDREAVQ